MEVYYGKNFWYSGQEGTPLKKIPVHDPAADGLLAWENRRLCIPAVYVGEEGLQISHPKKKAFLHALNEYFGGGVV